MTNPKIPKWVQAAIAKLNKKHDEKRQQFKQQGNRYHDGFADGLDAVETIFMREFKNSAPKENDIAEIELHSSHIITLIQSLGHMLHNLAKENETSSDLFKDTFEIFDFFVNDLDIEKSKYVQENQAANQFIADVKQVAHEIKNQPMEWERLTFTASELLQMLKEAEPQSGWIPFVKNGGFEDGQEILLTDGDRVWADTVVIDYVDNEYILYFNNKIYPDGVTHWQPLPQPPKE